MKLYLSLTIIQSVTCNVTFISLVRRPGDILPINYQLSHGLSLMTSHSSFNLICKKGINLIK